MSNRKSARGARTRQAANDRARSPNCSAGPNLPRMGRGNGWQQLLPAGSCKYASCIFFRPRCTQDAQIC
eukprot:3767727-Pyramimonas_sp.AAC.1